MNRPFLIALLSAVLVSTSEATVVFNQPHNGGGTLHKSSWYPPDGLDGDVYCWDNFTLASNTAISEIRWRGGVGLAPNPFQQATTIFFDLPRAADVRVEIYDTAGRHVRTLASTPMPAGNRSVTWDGVDGAGRRVSAGVYFLRLETSGGRQDRRMLLLK